MQEFKVNLTVQIPEDYVLITKVEFEELQQEKLSGVYWTMKDLEQRIGKKHEWIKENIIYPSKFKKQLDVNCGGFVYYPTKSGEKWVFQASKMARFLDDNFHRIFGGK
ncbi:DUF771 domain-containing protein [Ureibacillus composti]